MKTVRFGIIGCGLMGREFASAAARWCHLPDMDVRPGDRGRLRPEQRSARLVHAATSRSIRQVTADYRAAAGQPGRRGRLLRRAAPPARGDLLRGDPGRQAPAGRETLRHRPGRPTQAILACAARAPAGPRALLVGVSVLSGRAADRTDDRRRRLRPDHRGQRRLPALQRSGSATSRSTGSASSSSTASTAAWATWACTSATCRSAPAGCRGTCAPCCPTSSPSGPTAGAAWRPARRGTTPRCCARRPTRRGGDAFP